MQPSALRALEFDRIVEAVTGFALTPMGAARLSELAPSTDPQQVAQSQAATTETVRFVTAHGLFPLRASSELPKVLEALGVEGRALESLRLLALATFLDSIDESRAEYPPRTRILPAARVGHLGRGVVQGRVGPGTREDRPVGRGRRQCQPRAAADSRTRPQAEDAAAHDAGVVPARQGNREVPPGSGRVRTERPLRAAREGRAPRRHSGHRPRNVDERREPVSRAVEHGRNQQRHRRARGAGSRGGPENPARADRCVPPPRRRHGADRRDRDRPRRPAGTRTLL